jgi:glutaryl-CoA dehydrogenase
MSIRPTGSPARGVDFFDTDAELSDEERLIRDSVRAFVNESALPILDDAFKNDRFPMELVPRMAEMGLLGSYLEGHG